MVINDIPRNQYIGARYVPIVYKNPDDGTANWKANVEYEPLTIVIDNSDSYTSKKAVPASVGRPSSNGDYWVKTGDFNAGLLALQRAVQEINDKIGSETLDTDAQTLTGGINEVDAGVSRNLGYIQRIDRNLNRKRFEYGSDDDIIVIGDSWANGLHGDHGIWYYLNQRLPHNNFYHAQENGAGFVKHGGEGGTGMNFLELLQSIEVDEANDIKHIIVIGGVNDRSQSNVPTAISNFMTYVHNTYPNAGVDICIVNRLRYGQVFSYDYVGDYNTGSASPYARVFNLIHCIPINQWYDDGHLNTSGYDIMSYAIKNAVTGGKYFRPNGFRSITMSNSDLSLSNISVSQIWGDDGYVIRTGAINLSNYTGSESVFKRIDMTLSSDIDGNDTMIGFGTVSLVKSAVDRTVRPCKLKMTNTRTLRFEWIDLDESPVYTQVYIDEIMINFGHNY